MKKLIIFFLLSALTTIGMRFIPNVESIWYLYFLVSSLTYLLGIFLLFRIVYLLFKKFDLIDTN
jgi:hypothetical protein